MPPRLSGVVRPKKRSQHSYLYNCKLNDTKNRRVIYSEIARRFFTLFVNSCPLHGIEIPIYKTYFF